MSRLPNPRLAKIHRNYTTGEVAELFGVHKQTVRGWMKDGLSFLDDQKPYLIPGLALREYLSNKRQRGKCKTRRDELYCMKCRAASRPAGGMLDYITMQAGRGRLTGICPHCDTMMNRFSNDAEVEALGRILDVTVMRRGKHISDGA